MYKLSSLEIEETLKSEDVWETETLRELSGESLSDHEVLLLLTKNVIKTTNGPFIDFYVFEDIVHVLNGIEPDVEGVEGALPEQIWHALEIMKSLKPDAEFSHEVLTYIKFFFKDAGLVFLPPVFPKEENKFLDKVIELSTHTPLVEGNNPLVYQAIQYLKIMQYIESK